MIDRLLSWCIGNRFLVIVATASLAVAGAWAARHTLLDAVPDLSDVQVIVSTEWTGRNPELIENQVTYPLVNSLLGTPGVRTVRAVTDLGISYIYAIFEDGTDRYWARSRVAEQVEAARAQLPMGVTPVMASDASPAGRVFEYAVVDDTGRYGLDGLRSLQDWTIRYGLASVRGVAEIATIGGFVKQYQVNLNPDRLSAFNITAKQIVDAIRTSNNDVEGRVIEFSGREYMVRSRGSLTSADDIQRVPLVMTPAGTPVRVGDVAEVRVGPDMRRGVAELDGTGETVGGIVIMRVGQNALDVIARVKTRLAELQRGFPAGVRIVPVYDRSELINQSIRSLRKILIEEILVVSVVVYLFLFQVRATVIPVVVVPIAVLASFIPVYYFGITANIMSLGGIALAIGVLIDATLVIVENGSRALLGSPEGPSTERTEILLHATRKIGRPVFLSILVIVVSFVPVFMLEGQEGRLFRPLALTKTFGVGAATLLALTIVPVLMVTLLRRPSGGATGESPISKFFEDRYEPVLRFAMHHKTFFLLANAALIPLTAALIPSIGREFMPPLYEGTILYMPSAPSGTSIREMTRLLQVQDRVLGRFPEVERVFGTAGRASTAMDNSPLSMVNTIVTLKPRAQWRTGMTFDGLRREMDAALQMPGFPNTWTQPIRNRMDMLATGIKTTIGIKVLGGDIAVLGELGRRIETILAGLTDTQTVYAERMEEGSFLDIRIDRASMARYGVAFQDVEDVIQTAIGGSNIARTTEGREHYPINVRYEFDFRSDIASLERLAIKMPSGRQVFLGQVSSIVPAFGPAMVRDEDGSLAEYVYVEPSTRDIGRYVARAKRALANELSLPTGYRLEWSGQYELQQRAAERLRLIIPAALAVIFILLCITFYSSTEAAVIMLSVVYAMTGGIIIQWCLGYQFSVAVWVGYLALFGVAVQTGIIMVVYLQHALRTRESLGTSLTRAELLEATVEGAVLRLRPKLMTVFVTVSGLLPIMWSTDIGADVLKPIAAPIIGGMLTSAMHVLFITPIIFYMLRARRLT